MGQERPTRSWGSYSRREEWPTVVETLEIYSGHKLHDEPRHDQHDMREGGEASITFLPPGWIGNPTRYHQSEVPALFIQPSTLRCKAHGYHSIRSAEIRMLARVITVFQTPSIT